jgi:hypothetical protein
VYAETETAVIVYKEKFPGEEAPCLSLRGELWAAKKNYRKTLTLTKGSGLYEICALRVFPLTCSRFASAALSPIDGNGVKLAHPSTSLRYAQGERSEKHEINYRSC